MQFAINSATHIEFTGPRYIHALVNHNFSGQPLPRLSLCARARQFSSFILVVGNVISGTSFNPKHAIIIQNKDDILIPLLLEEIPTPQAFRDAIESLSPEQQRFAKAFRSMQLESTLFGVCIIQIKPQLEKVLNLPNDSLTKEIQLTQDLLSLFIEYQVPSDLLSFDPQMAPPDVSVEAKVNQVKTQVEAMQAMIDNCKQKELEEQKAKAEYERQKIIQAQLAEQSERRASPRGGGRGGRGGGPIHLESMQCRPMRAMAAPTGARMASLSRSSMAPTPKLSSSASKPASVSVPPTAITVPVAPVEQPKPSQPEPSQPDPIADPMQVDKEGVVASEEAFDFTQLPTRLDANFEKYDLDAALHSVIIKVDNVWQKKSQPSLLAKPETTSLDKGKLKSERESAFDLLDALTRSGALEIDDGAFHVVLAASHSFDQTLMDTLVKKNVNPIEKLERSTLIVASTITEQRVEDLIKPDVLDRVRETSPNLF